MSEGLALVTGASGFIGANVARVLLGKGYEVRALVRPRADRRNLPVHPRLRVCEGDLRDASSLTHAVRGCAEVYHVAADYRFWAREPQELYASNVGGTENLLRAASATGVVKFVHTSTVGTIGLAGQPRPCHEETAQDPGQVTSHYKRSKGEAERIALAYAAKGFPVVIVNPSAPIGPWDRKPTPTGKIIVDFMRGKLPAYVDTGLNFVHVRDVAEGHWLAARKGRIGERYILGHRNLSMPEFLRILADITGIPAPRLRVPYGVAYLVGWLSTGAARFTGKPPAVPLEAVKMSRRYMFFDPGKAVRELGLPQTSVEQAAVDAVNWFRENGFFSFQGKRWRETIHGSPT